MLRRMGLRAPHFERLSVTPTSFGLKIKSVQSLKSQNRVIKNVQAISHLHIQI